MVINSTRTIKLTKATFILTILAFLPFTFQLSNVNNASLKKDYLSTSLHNSYDFKPIDNFVNPYLDNFNASLYVDYSNKYEGNFGFAIRNPKVSFHNERLSANKLLFKNADISKVSQSSKNVNFTPVINDFINPTSIDFVNGKNVLIPSNNKSTYKALLKCGKKHTVRKVCSDPKHLHSRACSKLYSYDCTGCISGTEDVTFQKIFSNHEYDIALNSSMILSSEFDIGKLLKIKNDSYVKSFDKTFLTLNYNFDYLKSIMMGSFNLAYATEFLNNHSWMFPESLKKFISLSILQNKITIFDGLVPKYFGYTNKNYDQKHDIRYWMENLDLFSEEYIKQTISSLKIMDFGQYINKNKLSIKNHFIGKNLYNVFSNNDLLKNIILDIKYELGEKNKLKKHSISLFELINNKNNKLIYYFTENANSVNSECQDIKINSISVRSNNNNVIYLQNYQTSYYLEDKQNNLSYIDFVSNNDYSFNDSKKFSNLFTALSYQENMGKELLIKNKVFGFAKDNLNETHFGVFSNFNDYIKPIDELIISNISNDSNNFLNNSLKKIIKNYKMVPNDYQGIIDIEINFIDDSTLKYQINGFEKIIDVGYSLYNQTINYSRLGIKYEDKIDKEYILNELIIYSDNEKFDKNKSLFSTKLSKAEFKNILKHFSIIYNDKSSEINIVVNDNYNDFEYKFIINNDLKNEINNNVVNDKENKDDHKEINDNISSDNSANNNKSNNEIDGKNQFKKNDYWLIVGYAVPPLIFIVIAISLIYFLVKRKRNKKK